jgi:hypothetical protein
MRRKGSRSLFGTRYFDMEKEQEDDKEERISELFCFV